VIIFRYLCKQILGALVATTLVLLIIFLTNQFVHYLNDAAQGLLTVTAVMQIMALQVPLLLGYLLPLGLFLGILTALGKMYSAHEMVVLSACGVSKAKLVGMVMFIAVFVMLANAWLMLFVVPKMELYRAKIIDDLVVSATLQTIIPGRFQDAGSKRVIYAESKSGNPTSLGGVFFAQEQNMKSNSDPVQWDVVVAKNASEARLFGGRFWVFQGGYRYFGMPGNLNYRKVRFKEYGLRLDRTSHNVDTKYQAKTIRDIWHKRHHDLRAMAEFQWRISMPISALIFALLAIPLSYVNPRKGRTAQILPAIAIYVVYANFMFMTRSWIKNGEINPDLGLWWIHGTLFVLAILLLVNHTGLWHRMWYKNKRKL
jgi:lipopolysaccharide export system permease protein